MAFIPAALLLVFALWAGTFHGGATFSGAAGGYGAVLAVVLLAFARSEGIDWRDPLRLGNVGRWLPIGLWLVVVSSCLVSPVPRAGLVASVLLPAFLAVPAAVSSFWSDAAARRRGALAMSAVVGIVAAWALVDRYWLGSARAAMPLGHHNLLSGFLVALLPLALLPLRERSTRWCGVLSGGLAVGAIVASGSLLGAVALAAQGALALLWWRRFHKLLLPAALLILGLQMPRVLSVLRGADPSTSARVTYLEAGWRGLGERALVGWGPGSTPWTIAEHMRPRAGINPPSEVVGDLHSLPLQILYELGWVGFACTLGTAALFLRRRIGERATAESPAWLAAGLIGLLGAAVTRLGGASLAVTALPITVGIAAGAALSARPPHPDPLPEGEGERRRAWVVAAYCLVAAIALFRPLLATRAYESGAYAVAHSLDPAFPLYSARASWELVESSPPEAATQALAAARQGRALAPLWLQAGWLGLRSGDAWAPDALARAALLDPLSAPAHFWLAIGVTAGGNESISDEAVGSSAHALAAEPRLLAAEAWRGREALRRAAVRALETDPTIDAGWRAAFVDAARQVEETSASHEPGTPDWLGLTMDGAGASDTFSLYAFRRAPSPALLAPIAVDADVTRNVPLSPAVRRAD